MQCAMYIAIAMPIVPAHSQSHAAACRAPIARWQLACWQHAREVLLGCLAATAIAINVFIALPAATGSKKAVQARCVYRRAALALIVN